MKFIVGCDVDGVLTNLSEHYLKEGKKVFKREAVNPDAYSIDEMFDLSDFSKLKLSFFALKIFLNYCKNEPPRKYVSEVIQELSNDEFEFNSISARKFASSNSALGLLSKKLFKDWLDRYNINFNSHQFCSDKNSAEDKLLACEKLCVDVMIEDTPSIALLLAHNGIKVIMINAPYNLNTVHENIIHVDDWIEVKEILKKLKSEKEISQGYKTKVKR